MAAKTVLWIARKAWVVVLATAALGCSQAVLQPNSPATKLAFRVQPLDASANQPLTPAIEVRVQDDAGNPAQDFVGNVTISISDNGAGGILSGTTTQALSHGIATFRDLSIDRPGSGYTLVAVAPGFNITKSAAFTVACNTNCWTAKAPMGAPVTASAIGAFDGMLYAVGGLTSAGATGTVEAYDPRTNTWSRRASPSLPRFSLGVGVLNGILYAVGGAPNGESTTSIVEAYDPVTNTWTTKASLSISRSALGIAVANGRLYAIGGTDKNGRDTTLVEAYDPNTDTWSTQAPLPVARSSFGTAVANGIIYVIGGDVLGSPVGVIDAYDPASDTWTARAPMPTRRSGLGAASVSGLIYAVGGTQNGVRSTVEAYDPVRNTWVTRASLPTARVLLSVDVLDGILYAVGGSSAGAPFPGTNEAYRP
jgi:N-acetylneuraminic acid mutarotase